VRAWGRAEASIVESVFLSSRANRGGAISVVGASLSLKNTFFSNCTAQGGGGALSVIDFQCYGARPTHSEVKVDLCVFDTCRAPGGTGGAIMVSGGSSGLQTVTLHVFSSTFKK
jgi:hypothetical protein